MKTSDSTVKTEWPSRGALCLDCRTLVAPGRECPVRRSHRVRRLDDHAQREQVLSHVWGPPPLRRRIAKMAKAGAAGGATGGFSSGGACTGCDLFALDGSVAALAAAIVICAIGFIVVVWLVSAVVRAVRRSNMPKPNGAPRPLPSLGLSTGQTGYVSSEPSQARSPFSSTRCVAYGVMFSVKSGFARRAATLRDGVSRGFEVALASGKSVRIAPGPIRLDMSRAAAVRDDGMSAEAYLNDVDPRRLTCRDLDPLPREHITELVITDGAEVEILSPLRLVADGSRESGYREMAATNLEPIGVPRLRLVRR